MVKTKTASLIFEEEKDQLQVVDKLQIVDKGVAPTVQNVGDLFVEGRIITLSCAQQRARVRGDASGRPVAGSPPVVSDGELGEGESLKNGAINRESSRKSLSSTTEPK